MTMINHFGRNLPRMEVFLLFCNIFTKQRGIEKHPTRSGILYEVGSHQKACKPT
uniref:Uncharacterized protein n=1 Tax=Arundo donax TaxID=35708 RepID=A0A0A9E9R5_ARUDO